MVLCIFKFYLLYDVPDAFHGGFAVAGKIPDTKLMTTGRLLQGRGSFPGSLSPGCFFFFFLTTSWDDAPSRTGYFLSPF